MTIKEILLSRGMVESDFGNWQSDLHIKVTPISKAYFEQEFEFPKIISTFKSKIDGSYWFDLPLGFLDEFIALKQRKRGSLDGNKTPRT